MSPKSMQTFKLIMVSFPAFPDLETSFRGKGPPSALLSHLKEPWLAAVVTWTISEF